MRAAAVDADEDVLRRDVAVDEVQRLAVRRRAARARRAARRACRASMRSSIDRGTRSAHRRWSRARAGARACRPRCTPSRGSSRCRSVPTSRMGTTLRVVDARGEPRLVEEHLDELLLAGEVRVQALDRDEALEAADAQRGARGTRWPCRPTRARRSARSDRASAASPLGGAAWHPRIPRPLKCHDFSVTAR